MHHKSKKGCLNQRRGGHRQEDPGGGGAVRKGVNDTAQKFLFQSGESKIAIWA